MRQLVQPGCPTGKITLIFSIALLGYAASEVWAVPGPPAPNKCCGTLKTDCQGCLPAGNFWVLSSSAPAYNCGSIANPALSCGERQFNCINGVFLAEYSDAQCTI